MFLNRNLPLLTFDGAYLLKQVRDRRSQRASSANPPRHVDLHAAHLLGSSLLE
ncbi:hypothetical protein [Sphaerothrix gracilis]|uniref:hypothetical protein n=1 Tax=Sphaerothrix gracilis TaxID=3151835 RepID=UPI0031FBA358